MLRMPFRVGSGHDVHSLVEGQALVLGGVQVPSAVGFDTHLDGDVLSHALVDALAGAIADGGLGRTSRRMTRRHKMPGALTSSRTWCGW